MAKQLGTLVLPDSLEWAEEHATHGVAQSTARTLGGAHVVFPRSLSKGRDITLEARDRVCWLTQADVDAILAMATQAGSTFALIWEGQTFTVMFRHEESPAAAFEPLFPHGDQYIGRIKLVSV